MEPQQTSIAMSNQSEPQQHRVSYAGSNAPQSERSLTYGEENLAERGRCDNFMNFCGILLSIAAIGFEVVGIMFNPADAFTLFISIVMSVLAFISLVINIVDYKTGDCECLRQCIMITVCLWWCKYCCEDTYHNISVKLLFIINAVLWAILFMYDIKQWSESDDKDPLNSPEDIITIAETLKDARDMKAFLGKMTLFKMVFSAIGFGTSIVISLFKCIGKAIKICCEIMCTIFCIALFIVTVIFVILALSSMDDEDSNL